jgi:YVTN family beta-propeller protein
MPIGRCIAPCLLFLSTSLFGQGSAAPAAGRLLVLSKSGETLSVVDPATLKVVSRVPAGKNPHEVVASADGSTAYISNYGYGAYNTISRVDLRSARALPPVDLGPLKGPHGLVFRQGELWFTAEVAKAIGRYDPAAGAVDWVLGLGQNRTHMLYVSPDASRFVTTNVNSGTVSIVEKAAMPASGANTTAAGPPEAPPRVDWNETVIPVGKGPEGFDVAPSGREAWVGNALDGTISVIDLEGKKVVTSFPTGLAHINRLRFTPDGRLVLVSTLNDPHFAIYDAGSRKVLRTLQLGHATEGILVEPGGARAYVACSPDGNVAVVDLRTFEVVGRIDAGPEPDGMAWAPVP